MEPMYFIRQGAGVPPILFVHGLACDHTDWSAQVAHFARTHEVVAADLPGHGRTPGRPEECTIARLGAAVAALVADLDWRGVVLVGHSMGCRVVLEAARHDPERLGGLVLLDGSLMGRGEPAAARYAMQQAIGRVGFPAFIEALFLPMFPIPGDLSRAILARAKRLPETIGTTLLPDLAAWDAGESAAALAAVRVPLLVLQSTKLDEHLQRVSMEVGETSPWLEYVRRHAPAACLEVIPGAGHFVQIEKAAEVNRRIEGWPHFISSGS